MTTAVSARMLSYCRRFRRIPRLSASLDQVNLPDPLAQELCRLQNRVYANEQKLKKEEEREREADK